MPYKPLPLFEIPSHPPITTRKGRIVYYRKPHRMALSDVNRILKNKDIAYNQNDIENLLEILAEVLPRYVSDYLLWYALEPAAFRLGGLIRRIVQRLQEAMRYAIPDFLENLGEGLTGGSGAAH